MAFNDMDLAGLSLCSLCPRTASCLEAGRLGYSVIGFAVFINRFAHNVNRTLATPECHETWSRVRREVPGAAGGNHLTSLSRFVGPGGQRLQCLP